MKLGVIGIGNMAQAIIQGIPDKDSVIISARTHEDTLYKANKLGVHAAANHIELVQASDIIMVAVKPIIFPEVMELIKPHLNGKTVVSIAGKLTLSDIEAMAGDVGIVRVMPNLNVAIQKGISSVCDNGKVSDEVLNHVVTIFNNLGETMILDESKFSGFSGVAGSSPAFVFKFIDALIVEAMKEGMSYEEALTAVTYSVSGSADYLRVSGTEATELVRRVCSPGGSTIEGIKALDADNFDASLQHAMRRTIDKDKGLY